jgi:hypothetical protein
MSNIGAPQPFAEQVEAVPLTQAGRFPVLDAAQLEVLRSYETEQEISVAPKSL